MAGNILKEYLLKFTSDVSGLNQAHSGVTKLNSTLKQLTKTLVKTLLGWTSFISVIVKAAQKLKAAVKWTLEMNKTLEKEAKSLNKSTEAARAHLVALKVMGKTMNEINKDSNLKKLYNELYELGKSMALPQAAKGLSTLQDLANAWTKVKYTAYYALQWIWYYIQKYLATPIQKIKDFLNGKVSEFASKIKQWAQTAAKYISYLFAGLAHIISSIKSAFSYLKELFQKVDGKWKAALVGIVTVLALILNKGLAIKALIAGAILLFDDFMAYIKGDKTALSTETWEKIITIALKLRNIVASIINAIIDIINRISVFFGGDPLFENELYLYSDYEIEAMARGTSKKARERESNEVAEINGYTAETAAETVEKGKETYKDGYSKESGTWTGKGIPIEDDPYYSGKGSQYYAQVLAEALAGVGGFQGYYLPEEYRSLEPNGDVTYNVNAPCTITVQGTTSPGEVAGAVKNGYMGNVSKAVESPVG